MNFHDTYEVNSINKVEYSITRGFDKSITQMDNDVKIIGVLGINGKTTTAHIIEEIFTNSGYRTGLISSLGLKINGKYILNKEEIDTYSTVDLMDKFKYKNIDIIIIEISFEDISLISEYNIEFDIVINTNNYEKINYNSIIKKYREEKKKLFDSLAKNKIAIINQDDKNSVNLVQSNNNIVVITYGFNGKASVTASSLQLDKVSDFNLCLQRGITTINGVQIDPLEFPISLNLLGSYNIYNCLAAISTCLCFGIDIKVISETLMKIKGLSRRLNKVYDKDFLVIDAFTNNPLSYDAVFHTIQNLDYNNLIVINSIDEDDENEVSRDNIEIISEWIDILKANDIILSLGTDVTEKKDKCLNKLILDYEKKFKENNIKYSVYDRLEDSINNALKICKKNDIVLLLGAEGMNKGENILLKAIYNKQKLSFLKS
ncbi:UDP-N-acetylmuramoyl-L-alanyl-D-glutamate--2, 6-diaminopimelate ligase MurE [Gottschalkia purinilytica]|uniref:UDP-N-acetylmuramoyl-L-alanyl-D-glutamate--2, 6-diaminopimelate ligase MurE n=1 Tax=Gottschalkia purinilytica TaxID=1503 RepID=A0A0L0W7F2_GOTPU|nr:Mur ligase family protein [Gottschalkia purinilytica]KNF07458.1 UDP-N-acetylmuramoyl-L-alanyl-D-glutamate--2, 6-diaminopimelate ligase MurE [Gottschalkia purinilytica]